MLEDMIGGGTGLYSLNEAARYARMHPNTLARWLKGNCDGERVFLLEDAKVITFLDFMQVLAVRNLRVNWKIPLPKIREAVDRAIKDFGINYPFARKHTTYLFDGNVWIRPEGVPEKEVIQASGKGHGQRGIITVVERFLIDVSFDPETKLADGYKAYHKDKHQIFMNPKVRFGEPILDDSGYTPEIIFDAVRTEGSVEAAAKAYDISKEQVNFCVDYIDYLQAA